MNKLLIPPSPNWYETDIMACAPDNTLIYGSRQDIIVIKTTPENEPDDVQVITRAHSMRIKSININRNWGQPHKYAVIVSEDKVVKLWDIESLEKKFSHNKHIVQDDDTKVISACFAGDDRVISTSESGTVVIWNITKNETNVLSSLFDIKVTVTCLSVCPHAGWLAAFGLKTGLIAVADLRRTGKILYKLRGHEKPVISLSWCPASVNIFPVKPSNKVVEKCSEVNEEIKIDEENTPEVQDNEKLQMDKESDETRAILSQSTEEEESSNTTKEEIKESNYEPSDTTKEEKTDRRKQKNPKKAPNPWVGLVHADDDSKEPAKTNNPESDFLKECSDLRQHILQMSTPKNESTVEETSSIQESASSQKVAPRAILKPKVKILKCNLSNLLRKNENILQTETEAIQKDVAERADAVLQEPSGKEKVDTPTDRRQISMEISQSVEKLDAKLTDTNEKSMEITRCGRKESTNTVETTVSDIDGKEECKDVSDFVDGKESLSDGSKLDTTSSSEESKKFSSVSSCDNDTNCTKKQAGKEDVRKSDTSSTSESGDVFHDAQLCKVKGDEGSESCRVVEAADLEEQPRKEFLLASSAREPKIYIWRAGTDGRMQSFMTVPAAKNQNKSRSDKMWITVCWVAPNILLSSSRSSELLQWTLPKPLVQAKFVRSVHKDHWSVLFSIKAPILYHDEYNFLQQRDINAWTTGMDRTILNTDIGSKKNLGCYPALGGSVNCLSGSPLDPNRLAIGTGEGVLNIWDLSREHKKRIVFSNFYQKIVASVTALAWHPRIETTLALATVEGRIGILDIAGKAKSPKLLTHYFKTEIYKIEWGPLNGDVQSLGLFVAGDGKVAIFDPKSNNKDPQLLEMPDNTSVHTMSWKPDYSSLLVSSKSGSLITYTPDLKISNIAYVRLKLQSIVWNPNAASDDMSVSKYCHTFASIVKHTEFVVYDMGVQSENHEDKVIARFENRGVIINSLEWNPHSGNQLVLVDDVGVAQVYDIETKTVLATYVNRSLDSFLSAYWSPVDPDYVITGTVANKIMVWKVSENAPLTDKEINSQRNRIAKAQSKEVADQLGKQKPELSAVEETEVPKPKKSAKSNIVPLFYGMKEKGKVQDIRKLLQWKLGDKSVESNVGDGKYIDVLDVFDGQSNMERILQLNIASFRQKGQHHNGNLLTLFKGDVGTAIKEAIDQKRVNPWIISMCPMVSPKLWQTACETYANQLRDEPEADPLEIVTYLLACHKIEESVEVLCERSLFREALVLAQSRFGADNSLVFDIKDKWGKHLLYQGNLELAAQCYISIGKFEEAASVLFRRSNVELLELAVDLAKLSGNEELHKAVLFRFGAFKTAGDQLKEFSKLTDKNKENDSSKEMLAEKNKSGEIKDDCNAEVCTCEEAICTAKKAESDDIQEYLKSQKKLLCKTIEIGSDAEVGRNNESYLIGENFSETVSDVHEMDKYIDFNKHEILKSTEESPKLDKDDKDQKLVNKKEEPGEFEESENKNLVELNCNKKGFKEKSYETKDEDSNKESDKADGGSPKQVLSESSNEEAKNSDKVALKEARKVEKDSDKSDQEFTKKSKKFSSESCEEKELDDIAKIEVESKSEDSHKTEDRCTKKACEAKDIENCDVKFTEKVKELLPDLLKEEVDRDSDKSDQEFSKKSKEFSSESCEEKEELDDIAKIEAVENKSEASHETEDRCTKKASETKDIENCDVKFTEKVKVLLPDLLKEEGDELDELAQNVLKSQAGLLSTDEVKELLSKRKISLEGDGCTKEEE